MELALGTELALHLLDVLVDSLSELTGSLVDLGEHSVAFIRLAAGGLVCHDARSQVDNLADLLAGGGGQKGQGGQSHGRALLLGDDLDLFAIGITFGNCEHASNSGGEVIEAEGFVVEVPEIFSVVHLFEGRATLAAEEDVVASVEELLGDGVGSHVLNIEPVGAVLTEMVDEQDGVLCPLVRNLSSGRVTVESENSAFATLRSSSGKELPGVVS